MNLRNPQENYTKYNNYNQYKMDISNFNLNNKVQNFSQRNINSLKNTKPVNYLPNINYDDNNEFISNTFDKFEIPYRNSELLSKQFNNVTEYQSFDNNNDIINQNKLEEIQERYDKYKSKLNQMKNLLSNYENKFETENYNNFSNKDDYSIYELNDFDDINFNNINRKNNVYNPRFQQKIYKQKFKSNNNNKRNNLNNVIINNNNNLRDLNKIHNNMEKKNPRASLIKKMTKYHINDNNNIYNNNYNLITNLNTNKILNNNNLNNYKLYQNTKIISNNNINNNNYNFQTKNNQRNLKKTKNLTNFDINDINKYPHEIQQISGLNNSKFNINNNKYPNNNKFLVQKNNNQNNMKINNNYNQFYNFNNDNYNYNNLNNKKSGNKNIILSKKEKENYKNDDENSNSDNLSDLAEDLIEYTMEAININEKNDTKNNNNLQNILNNNKQNLNSKDNSNLNNKNINDNNQTSLMSINNLGEFSFNNYNNMHITQNINYNNYNNYINLKDDKEKSIENQNNINNINNQLESNIINNSLGKDYIDNTISKDINKDIMDKLYYIQNTKGIDLNQKYIFLNNEKTKNNNNNTNEDKDSNINLNNINLQKNQIYNSNNIAALSKENKKINEKQLEREEKKFEILTEMPEKKENKIYKNEKQKVKRSVEINLDKNIICLYKIDSNLEDPYEVYNGLGFKNIKETPEIKKGTMDLDVYLKKIKVKNTLKPCIKSFDKNLIKIDENYIYCENLTEEQIIPDLYEESSEEIKSLAQSLEKSVDKMFCSVNESNNMSLIDSNLYEYMNDNSNKEGKNLINKIQNIIEENEDENSQDNFD